MCRPDARDWHALPCDGTDYRVGLAGGIAGLRIAASATLGFVDVDPEVLHVFRAAVDALVDLGAQVTEVDPPLGQPRELFARTLAAKKHLSQQFREHTVHRARVHTALEAMPLP